MRTTVASALVGKAIHFARKVTKTGKLYAAISATLIAEALKTEHSLDVAEDAIVIDDQIKATGTFQVSVKLGEQKLPVSVVVTAERAGKAETKS